MNHTITGKSLSNGEEGSLGEHTVRKISWWFGLLLMIGVFLVVRFLLVYAIRYRSFDPQIYGDAYWPRRYGLVMHLIGGSIAILTGPPQLLLGETRLFMNWHRTICKVYLAGVTLGCLSAYYLALTSTDVGWVFASGLFALGVAWTITTGMAYLAIHRRLFELHREWMIRSYLVTLAFVFFRLFDEVAGWLGVGGPVERLEAAAWLGWAVPLLIAEPILQWHRFRAQSNAESMAAAGG